jgi:peptide/nickel transport system substrate-binding protein
MLYDDPGQRGLSRRTLLERAGAAGLVLAAPGLIGLTRAADAVAAVASKTGGTLRVGLNFGSSVSRDPQSPPGGNLDIARALNVYERLFDYDAHSRLVPKLALSAEPNKAGDAWVVQLRQGVTWHDGSPFTPEDVIYSLKRILTGAGFEGKAILSMVDPAGLQKINSSSLRIRLRTPYSDFAAQLGLRPTPIVKNGTTDFTTPNGTGPFKFQSATPGQRETYVANKNYWVTGRPLLGSVELHDIADGTARLDALSANQIDAMDITDASQIATIRADDSLKLVASPSDGFNALCMNTQVKPFDDVRVRQAIRLIADRPQLIELAQDGYGGIGNDMFFRFDPLYPTDIPQRHQDLDHARFLLKKAGRPTLDVTLDTADALTGMLSGDLILSQQAKKAGLKLNVVRHDPATYWSTQLGKKPFVHDAYSHQPFLSMAVQTLIPRSPSNLVDTNWNDPATTRLIREATRTVDLARRIEIVHEIQKILWHTGGYMIWGSLTWFDAYRPNVQGVVPNAMRTLGDFRFVNVWLS